MRNNIVLRTLIVSLFPVIFLLAGCTADGAWDVLREIRGYPGPGTYTVELPAVQDTSIFSGDTMNYGSCATLTTDKSGGNLGNGRLLVLYDLSTISSAAVINSVEFKLTKTGGVLSSIDQSIGRLTDPWTEGGGGCGGASDEANWDDRMSGFAWLSSGGDYDPSLISTVSVSTNQEYTWSSAALTTLIDEWNQSITPNYGLIVGSLNTGTEIQTFASRENAATSNRPKLVINYTIP